jgi:L-amino acid N-acyltransferase YncA
VTSIPSLPECDVVLRDGSTIRLRAAQAADIPAITPLLHSERAGAAPEPARIPPFAFERDAQAAAHPAHGAALLAESGGTPIALAAYSRDSANATRAVVRVTIDPALAGRGVGTRMLEILARAAWADGIRVFDAWVRRDDGPTLNMLLASGFETERTFEAGFCRVTLSLAHTPAYQDRAAERSEAAATASMRSFFEPKTVAVIGASHERGKIGAEVLHNIIKDGYTGRLFAVHPSESVIDGVPAFPRVTLIPGDVDLAVIVVPARTREHGR